MLLTPPQIFLRGHKCLLDINEVGAVIQLKSTISSLPHSLPLHHLVLKSSQNSIEGKNVRHRCEFVRLIEQIDHFLPVGDCTRQQYPQRSSQNGNLR